MIGPLTLRLYSRSYCHLCDELYEALLASSLKAQFDVEVVDVDGDPDLEARYGERVPVLTLGDTEICHYFFDESRLREVLGAIR